MSLNEQINSLSTFAAYYGLDENVFFGNVGRSLEKNFVYKTEIFDMDFETLMNNDQLNSNSYAHDNLTLILKATSDETESKKSLTMKKKNDRFYRDLVSIERYYEAKLKKLVTTYDNQIKLLLHEPKDIQRKMLLNIFQNFLKERLSLQETLASQKNNVIRSHHLEIYGYYNESSNL